MNHLFRLSLLITLFIFSTGCAAVQAAEVPSVQLGALETIRGMQSVVRGVPGSMALLSADGDWVLFYWPRGVNYAMTVVSATGRIADSAGQNAAKLLTLDLAQGVNNLVAHGWKPITNKEIPAALAQVVMSYSVELIACGAQTLPTLLIVPVLPNYEINPEVQS